MPIACWQCCEQHYCSKECQTSHWHAIHKNSCSSVCGVPCCPLLCSVEKCKFVASRRCKLCHKKVICYRHLVSNDEHHDCVPLSHVYATGSTPLQQILLELYSAEADTWVVASPYGVDRQYDINNLLSYVVKYVMQNMTPSLTETDLLGMPLIDRKQQCERMVNWLIEVVNTAKNNEYKRNRGNDPTLKNSKPSGVTAITPSSFSHYHQLLPPRNERHDF